ncbi:MAG: VWA domain-containing protein [Methylococcaceae bacterium]|nr:VWA domain-containing protein [Methylococcaceae bacterium]MDZ4156987.1 VWA domain-containing protein [Methylococcales bacterium]MDP2392706.1 VWA domain-containing protein [Methylococcaceae bacterium]MDP3018571.1 VWA domain-containing protein [Methylococcaceae bacterium]MDP3391326.1 VWA domain-containing protein [Methylococcaceae bacterium]
MNLTDLHFIRPYWLLSLIPYLVILLALLKNKLQQGNWTQVCDAELLPYLLQQKVVKQSRLPLTAGAIAGLLSIFALAGPTWQRLPSPVFKNDSAVVIALDISRTMDAQDIKPSRLIRARYKIADILKRRKDGQTALLVYAGDAFTVTPLTDDSNTIDSQLSALDTSLLAFAPGRNTALVLKRATELLRRAGALSGDIILVTDGADLDNALPAAKALENYRLSVLAVGSEDGAPITLPEGGFVKDKQGNIVIPKMAVDELASLAKAGNGVFQTISADDRDIETLLANIEKPNEQGRENNNMLLDQWDDKGPWLLLLALPLAALSFRKGLLCIGLLLLLPLPKNSYAFEWQDLWQNKNQQAQEAFKKNQFEQAAEKFESPEWKAAAQYKAGQYQQAADTLSNSNTADAAYNQGNAFAQQGQLEQAIKSYEKALQLNPNNSDAKYNKELVEKELEKQKQQQDNKDQKQDDQQDKKDQSKEDSDKKDDKDGKKSESSDEQKKSDQKSESSEQQEKDSEKQPEKPEQQESAKQQEQPKKAEENKPETEPTKSAEQKQEEQQKAQQSPAQQQEKPKDETEQANQQWLNRIPDDPAGLLRRKFEYQYKYEYQRKRNRQGDN